MREQFKMEAHHPVKTKRIPWSYCTKCGLVYLNNNFTRWSIQHGCNYEDHPQFETMRAKFTGGVRP